MIKRRLFIYILLIIPFVNIYASDRSLAAVMRETGATLYWDSALSRGYLMHRGYRVTFSTQNKEVVLGTRLVNGKVFLNKSVVFFDKRTADMITSYLKDPLSENYLAFVNQTSRKRTASTGTGSGHRVEVILIDPGHGGKDSGAIGRHGDLTVREKDITLTISLELEAKLKKAFPNRKILMTRRTDIYPTLEDRVEMANQQKLGPGQAEIYISIHANATPRNANNVQGFEVWYLPDTFERKITSHNAIQNRNLRTVLDKVVQEEYLAESKRLAEFLLQAMDKGLGHMTKNRGIRREGWFVVRNAQMAAVLVEVGFVTHPEEAQRLAEPAHLKTLADLLYNGIRKFLEYFEQ
ncbi:MAG: N-acetylmuramoyl-L-alanine amidase family protein [Spirochaetia bacterium]